MKLSTQRAVLILALGLAGAGGWHFLLGQAKTVGVLVDSGGQFATWPLVGGAGATTIRRGDDSAADAHDFPALVLGGHGKPGALGPEDWTFGSTYGLVPFKLSGKTRAAFVCACGFLGSNGMPDLELVKDGLGTADGLCGYAQDAVDCRPLGSHVLQDLALNSLEIWDQFLLSSRAADPVDFSQLILSIATNAMVSLEGAPPDGRR